MKRADLEHLIRAAAAIASDTEIIVVGSQAILGQFPDAPAPLCVSDEADVYPRNHPDRSDLIDGSIGELSPFHQTFGYYAQGVAPGTAILPAGWEERLIAVNTPATLGATGWCLEIHDLLVSKCIAGREKDRSFCQVALAAGLASGEVLRARLASTALEPAVRAVVADRLEADLRAGDPATPDAQR